MDLASPQQMHGYTYANNTPVTLSDPAGLDPGGGHDGCNNGCAPGMTRHGHVPGTCFRCEEKAAQDRSDAVKIAKIIQTPASGDKRPNIARMRELGYRGSDNFTWHDAIVWSIESADGYEYVCRFVAHGSAEDCGTLGRGPDPLAFLYQLTPFADLQECFGRKLEGCGWLAANLFPPAKAAKAAAKANDIARVDPNLVRYSQDSATYRLSNGNTIDDLVDGLRTGAVKPEDIPPIRLVERDGKLFTLDNRRLVAFQAAGIRVPYRMATSDEIAKEIYKFTTETDGRSIQLALFGRRV